MRSNVSGSEGKIQFSLSKYSHSHILKIRASIKIIRKPEPILIYKAPKERTSLSFVRKYKMINKEFYPHLFCRKLRCKKIFLLLYHAWLHFLIFVSGAQNFTAHHFWSLNGGLER